MTEDTRLSPWWSPTHRFKHYAGLAQRMALARTLGVSFREWGRLTSVIKENWSSMGFLMTIELAEPVYAWFGGFKSMNRLDVDKTGVKKTSLRDASKEKK